MVERPQAWYFRVLLHLDKLLCSAVVFRLLYFTRSGRCVSFPSGCVQLQLNSCSYVQPRHTCCVRCHPRKMPQTAHQRKAPYVLVHMMAAHTAFDYELVSRGSSCTWPLCHVPLSFFREAKWPSTSSRSTVAIVKTIEPPTCLYCTDIRIVISFLAVQID